MCLQNFPNIIIKKVISRMANRLIYNHPQKRPKTATQITFFLNVGSKFVFGEIVALNALYFALKSWKISRIFSL